MGKKILFIGGILLIVLIIGIGFYFYFNENNSEPKTYEECIQQALNKLPHYKPASEELVGAERMDNNGNIWVKQEDGLWRTNDVEGYQGVSWGDILIDEQIGGVNFDVNKIGQIYCTEYIITNQITSDNKIKNYTKNSSSYILNEKMTNKLIEIIDEVIQEQSQKGIIFSVGNVRIINLTGRVEGLVDLECSGESINYEIEKEIISNIADKLFAEYPDDFAEDSIRDSFVNIDISCGNDWRISDGYYSPEDVLF